MNDHMIFTKVVDHTFLLYLLRSESLNNLLIDFYFNFIFYESFFDFYLCSLKDILLYILNNSL